MNDRDILTELEDVLRTAPTKDEAWDVPEQLGWVGRAKSVLSLIQVGLALEVTQAINVALSRDQTASQDAKVKVLLLVHQARHKLRMRTVGPQSVAVNKGMVFDYFDALRRIIEEAQSELLFIDPYLDADFVPRYLGFLKPGVKVRLLARERLKTLTPAVRAYAAQHNLSCEVRLGSGFHDRFLFVDGARGFMSGASFKDGGIKSPTVLVELTDTFHNVLGTYEGIWEASALVT